ncbi:MAG: 2-dehydropantoate 2-reductase [Chloroflexota bacterium]|nr:2-dehydropantoate 2-reductase [Chloroflexota bacterium]
MRILICGAGAMGSLFGGYLTLAGEEVWLLSHWVEHIERIRREGLLLHPLEGAPLQIPIPILSYDDPLPHHVEVAFISVKSADTPEAARQAANALAPTGVAITMQNGIGNHEKLADEVGAKRALLGVTTHGATLLGPGEVRHAGTGPTYIASQPDREAATRIAALLTRAGFVSQIEREIEPVVWNKLLINVGINALTAILGVRNGVLAEHEPSRDLLRAAVEEAASVARAKSIPIHPDSVERTLSVAHATAYNVSSMLADVRRRVPTEIDVMNAAIVREGLALGIPTPVNETLTRLVQTMEATYAAPEVKSIERQPASITPP